MKRPSPTKSAPKQPGTRVKIDWAEAKHDALKGMTYEAIGRKFGVAGRTVKERAVLEDWPTPARLDEAARKIEAMRDAVGNTFTLADAEALLTASHEPDEDGVTEYQRLMSKLCMASMQHFGVAAPIPRSWKEVEIVDKIMRRTLGLDKQGVAPMTQVNVNVLRMDADPVVELSASVG